MIRILRASKGLSRLELANRLNLAPSTAGIYVARLMEDGFVVEGEKVGLAQGRPSTLLHLNPEGGEFIGVDFESRTIWAQAVDFANTPLRQVKRTIHPEDSAAKIINKIANAIDSVYPSNASKVLGIGVGVPGRVDSTGVVSLGYRHFSNWNNIPLAETLKKRFGVDVKLENNVRSMALAEKGFGQGREVEHFITLGVRGGIGLGAIVDGHLLRGFQNVGGEIGRWKTAYARETENSFLTVEELASINAILKRWQTIKQLKELPSMDDLLQAYQASDNDFKLLIKNVTQTLTTVISLASQLLDPQRIIISSPLCCLGSDFLSEIKALLKVELTECGREIPSLVFSELGEFSGALGAAALMVQSWKPEK